MNIKGQTDFNGDPQGHECINEDSTYTITIHCTYIFRSGVYSQLIHVNMLNFKHGNYKSGYVHSRCSHLSDTTYLGTSLCTSEQDSFLPQSCRQLDISHNLKFYCHVEH
jgi:hypothetical protein